MVNANKLKLDSRLTRFLDYVPENGMGYHIVDLVLKDGNQLINRIILNSTFLLLNKDERIEASSIIKIELHGENDFQ
jgi:hypothetical protein